MKLPIKYDEAHWSVRREAREAYAELQKGKCWHCRASLNREPTEAVQSSYINEALFPKGMFQYPIHLHHSRVDGLKIGALHARCNAWLWVYKNQ